MSPNCVARSISTVSPQSLMLMNNDRIRELAAAFARRVEGLLAEENKNDPAAKVDLVYRLALSRPPSEKERKLGILDLKGNGIRLERPRAVGPRNLLPHHPELGRLPVCRLMKPIAGSTTLLSMNRLALRLMNATIFYQAIAKRRP